MSKALHSHRSMLIIGHRGAMGYEVENSLSSIRKALEFGVEMIEIDVFKCKSGEIMVFHDDHLNRLANKDEFIEALNFSELKELQLSNGEQIPSLIEVMELTNGKAKLNIELKGINTAKTTFEIIASFVEEKKIELSDILISSFHWNELTIMRSLSNELRIGVLTEIRPLKAIRFAKKINAYSIHPRYNSLTKRKVRRIHRKGYLIFAYTVNSEKDITEMIELQIDGIFTNYPDRAINQVNRSFRI